jgi:chromosome segregation ATPase
MSSRGRPTLAAQEKQNTRAVQAINAKATRAGQEADQNRQALGQVRRAMEGLQRRVALMEQELRKQNASLAQVHGVQRSLEAATGVPALPK